MTLRWFLQKNLFRPLLQLIICVLTASTSAWALRSPQSEIRVHLFGQPCTLQGPVNNVTLKQIHSVSPEQLYPLREAQLKDGSTKKVLQKVRTTESASFPPFLERYRERLVKRLEAQASFIEGLEKFSAQKKTPHLIELARRYALPKKLKELEAQLQLTTDVETAFDQFSDAIEPDPEEEFHRGIQRMSIQYVCSFDEMTGPGSED